MIGDPKCPHCGADVPFLIQPKMVNGRLVGCGHACTNPKCKLNAGGKLPQEERSKGQPGWWAKAWASVTGKLIKKKAA